MCQKNYFPKTHGHQAWILNARSIEDAAIEDLFWRKVQTDPDFAEKVVKSVWPTAHRNRYYSKIDLNSSNHCISIDIRSCSSYYRELCDRPQVYLSGLNGDCNDIRYIKNSLRCPESGGYSIGPLIEREKGWKPKSIVNNLLRCMNLNMTPRERYLFDKKACHRRVLFSSREKEGAFRYAQTFYPIDYGYEFSDIYFYYAENGYDIIFGVIPFYNKNNNEEIFKVPVTAWLEDRLFPELIYDSLHPNPPYPIYDMHKLVECRLTSRYVFVCYDESTVEYIKEKYSIMMLRYECTITTYSDIENTLWEILKPMTPIILPKYSESGYEESFRLYMALKKCGFEPKFLIHQSKDIASNMFYFCDQIANNETPSLAEFAAHAQQAFDVTPPRGILPQAVSIMSLPRGANKLEPLMDGLLNHGELMMLFAWRGVGKSIFALFFAICCASAKTAFGGRICPSRKYKVLLIDAEMPPEIIKKRAIDLCYCLELPESVLNDIKVRSARGESKELILDTDAGWKDLEPDMIHAEIIIVDPVFKIFPSTMTADFHGTTGLQKFFDWCRENRKTLVIVDHHGKSGGTAFGSIGKEISLDVVVQLVPNKGTIDVKPTKLRNHPPCSGSWLKYRLTAADGRDSICPEALKSSDPGGDGSKALLPCKAEDSTTSPQEKSCEALEKAVSDYIKKNPQAKQKDVVEALKNFGKRSKIHARIKNMRERGRLPFWENPPNKAAGDTLVAKVEDT